MFNPQPKPTKLTKKKLEPIGKISSKQASINAKISQCYSSIERGNLCQGCLKTPWQDRAHIVSQKHCMELGKEYLRYDAQNILLLCRDCHNILDNGSVADKQKLLVFDYIVNILKAHDYQRYMRIVIEIENRTLQPFSTKENKQ
jgi:predicted restriction endonuclease